MNVLRITALAATAMLLSVSSVSASIIVGYTSSNTSGSIAPSVVDGGVTTSLSLSRSSGLTPITSGPPQLDDEYLSAGWTSSASPAADDYLEFGWSSSSAYDLTSLDVNYGTDPAGLVNGQGPGAMLCHVE